MCFNLYTHAQVNQFLVPRFVPHPFAGVPGRGGDEGYFPGEYREGFQVLVHHDMLLLVGGRHTVVYRDAPGGSPVLDIQGKIQYQALDTMDIWVSKGPVDMALLCAESEELTTQQILDRTRAKRLPDCSFFFTSLPGDVLRDSVLE